VTLTLRGPDGRVLARRQVHNLMTTLGLQHIADQLATVPDQAAMAYMAIGTGTDAPTAGDTHLQTEIHRHTLTSRDQGGTGKEDELHFIGDFAADHGTGTITEAGVFNALAVGTMACRATFTGIVKTAADTLHIDWKWLFYQPA
jgi:hypothetical protein